MPVNDLLQVEMQMKDRFEKEKADAKNSVEEYVYYMRDKLSDSYTEFITSEVRTKLKKISIRFSYSLFYVFFYYKRFSCF